MAKNSNIAKTQKEIKAEDKKFAEKLKIDRALEKLEEEQEIIDRKEESESSDLENLVNVSAVKYPSLSQIKISPTLEISQENQLETDLADIPLQNPAGENINNPDNMNNSPRYVQGSAALYGNSTSYDSNAGNYDDTSGYPKMISAPEFLNKGPSLGFSTGISNPSLGLRPSNNLASNEYPGMIEDESKKYEPVSGQKPNKRRY